MKCTVYFIPHAFSQAQHKMLGSIHLGRAATAGVGVARVVSALSSVLAPCSLANGLHRPSALAMIFLCCVPRCAAVYYLRENPGLCATAGADECVAIASGTTLYLGQGDMRWGNYYVSGNSGAVSSSTLPPGCSFMHYSQGGPITFNTNTDSTVQCSTSDKCVCSSPPPPPPWLPGMAPSPPPSPSPPLPPRPPLPPFFPGVQRAQYGSFAQIRHEEISSALTSMKATLDEHAAMLSCNDPGRRMADDEPADDSGPSTQADLRALIRSLTAQMDAQTAKMAKLEAKMAKLENPTAKDLKLEQQLFGQPALFQGE